jgi:hypothetical protein
MGEASDDAQARGWKRVAKLAALGFVIGSVPYLGCAFTVGLISGLVVLLAPLYPVLFQVTLITVAVALALAGRRHGLARGLGLGLALGPALVAVSAYVKARLDCATQDDARACVEYLHGQPPLLPIVLGGYLLLALVMSAVVLFVVRGDVRREAR